MNINGTWEGEYIYGASYPAVAIGKAVKFVLTINTNGSSFEGFFTDEETTNIFPEGGELEGVAENNYISFTMRYPCAWYVEENGSIRVEWEQPSHVIVHEGYFTSDRFEGKWEIPVFNEAESDEEV